ncbi:flagellar biosynthetic protein FlhB [Homoserinimonas aerilata]|uniref:Flagellar biosynthetic protein FlhB n=1 Tax=Homoserinimonas aerilata TaxID=1162970 RepID=A0A542YEX1_9MICO|nr:EscU/YscU/HrcU family type III secretion system export apparatus switch protein [Homoserinimonas aerilata]TQL46638.1 flagellar biosynthetic protein FlhB [Homoserinimonas aerilata]
MAEEPSGERTEQATEKRMKDVREKGQLSKSQDVTAWLGVGAAAVAIPGTIAAASAAGIDQLLGVATIAAAPDPLVALELLGEGLSAIMVILGPMLVAVLVIVVIGAAAQGGIHLKKFRGKFEQFNLVAGIKRTFGMQALWQGAKALLKTAVVGLVLFLVIQGLMPVLMSAGGHSVTALIEAAGGGAAALLQFAVAAGLVLAAADVFVVMKRNRKKTRMTKKEVRDENKNTDGDPLIKSQRRSRQLAMSRNRMIAAIGDADVVLVNPTHVAVALKYEPGKSAPRVVAKGSGIIAARIREEAETKGVPMVRDIPLARALHAACELGHEIPAELYDAVARILAFVMALKKRGAASGTHTIAGTTPAFPRVSAARPLAALAESS